MSKRVCVKCGKEAGITRITSECCGAMTCWESSFAELHKKDYGD